MRKIRPLRVIGQLRLFLRVQVVQIAVELVEAVHRREVFVAIAEVVLANLRGRIPQGLEQRGDSGVFLVQTNGGGRQTDFGQPRAQPMLTGDERRSSGRAALLAVAVGKTHALLGDPVDVGRAIAHQPVAVAAQVGDADIIAPDDDDIWFSCSRSSHSDLLSLSLRPVWLREPQQDRKEGEYADKYEEDGDRHDGRLHSLIANAGEWFERFTPQIANRPPVLPNRNHERHDAAQNKRETQIFRRGRKIGGVGSADLLQVVDVLHDREPEADQRHRGAQPRHYRAFEGEAGADPGKMAVCRYPYFEPACAWGGA